MYYRFLLAVLPLPVVVFLNGANAPDLSTFSTTMFSIVLGLLSAGALFDIFIDSRRATPDD